MAKNPPSKAGDPGSVPGWGAKIPHVAGQLSPGATITESVHAAMKTQCSQNNFFFFFKAGKLRAKGNKLLDLPQ